MNNLTNAQMWFCLIAGAIVIGNLTDELFRWLKSRNK